MERKRPVAGEVEIEVEATGLNFRDLMWSLGLLPEDMLENGFSGATLGLECAGKVVRVGADVTDLKVDDRVLCFAGSSFATHLNIKRTQAVKLPAGMTSEAAATIPVAFFTAYYSLVTQAQLSRGEWVLNSRRRRRRRYGGDPDRSIAQGAGDSDRGFVRQARPAACDGRQARARFQVDHLR